MGDIIKKLNELDHGIKKEKINNINDWESSLKCVFSKTYDSTIPICISWSSEYPNWIAKRLNRAAILEEFLDKLEDEFHNLNYYVEKMMDSENKHNYLTQITRSKTKIFALIANTEKEK